MKPKTAPEPRVQLHCLLPRREFERLRTYAKKNRRTMTETLRMMIESLQ
jgi:hypothetical protein